MALRREVHHHIRLLRREDAVHRLPVRDVRTDEPEIGLLHHGSQRLQVPGIGQFVQAHQLVGRMLLTHMEDEIAADKPGPASH